MKLNRFKAYFSSRDFLVKRNVDLHLEIHKKNMFLIDKINSRDSTIIELQQKIIKLTKQNKHLLRWAETNLEGENIKWRITNEEKS